MRHEHNDPLPGARSLWMWGSFIVGAGLLVFGSSTEDYNRAFYILAITFTALRTSNSGARCASMVGAALRAINGTVSGPLGFFLQTGAALYAMAPFEKAQEALRLIGIEIEAEEVGQLIV